MPGYLEAVGHAFKKYKMQNIYSKEAMKYVVRSWVFAQKRGHKKEGLLQQHHQTWLGKSHLTS
jgi:hypothetical protein